MVKHILKNGKAVKDITGHTVRKEDAPMVYQVIESVERRINGEGSKKRN